MKNIKLVIGDKNLSSWSMRPWLVLKASGIPFQEIPIQLDRKNTAQRIARYSPSGKVPVLIHNSLCLWDSLSICEYIAELAPEKDLWPKSASERALARSYVAEMHSSFQGLRSQLSMDIQLRMSIRHLSQDTTQDIQRILNLWTTALKASQGPFLFGKFGIVDAFYAPVVLRFVSYGVPIKSPLIKKYMKNIQQQPYIKEWVSQALKESYVAPLI